MLLKLGKGGVSCLDLLYNLLLLHPLIVLFVEIASFGQSDLTFDAIELSYFMNVVAFNLPEPLRRILELAQVSLLHVLADSLLARLTAKLCHLLPGLFEFHIAPLQIAVDGVSGYGDLGVELIVLPLIELRLEAVGFRRLEFVQLLINLKEHVLNLLSSIDPERR